MLRTRWPCHTTAPVRCPLPRRCVMRCVCACPKSCRPSACLWAARESDCLGERRCARVVTRHRHTRPWHPASMGPPESAGSPLDRKIPSNPSMSGLAQNARRPPFLAASAHSSPQPLIARRYALKFKWRLRGKRSGSGWRRHAGHPQRPARESWPIAARASRRAVGQRAELQHKRAPNARRVRQHAEREGRRASRCLTHHTPPPHATRPQIFIKTLTGRKQAMTLPTDEVLQIKRQLQEKGHPGRPDPPDPRASSSGRQAARALQHPGRRHDPHGAPAAPAARAARVYRFAVVTGILRGSALRRGADLNRQHGPVPTRRAGQKPRVLKRGATVAQISCRALSTEGQRVHTCRTPRRARPRGALIYTRPSCELSASPLARRAAT